MSAIPFRPFMRGITPEFQAGLLATYARVAADPTGAYPFPVGRELALRAGYQPADLDRVPEAVVSAFTGVRCPQRHAEVEPGMTIVDLACGSGLDTVLYAQAVGPTGSVLGIELVSGLVDRANAALRELGLDHARVILGSVETIPLPDASVDLVSSNGIYNLVPDRRLVLAEACRVLRLGGNLVLSDIFLRQEIDPAERDRLDIWLEGVGGAIFEGEFLDILYEKGFQCFDIRDNDRAQRTDHPGVQAVDMRACKPDERGRGP